MNIYTILLSICFFSFQVYAMHPWDPFPFSEEPREPIKRTKRSLSLPGSLSSKSHTPSVPDLKDFSKSPMKPSLSPRRQSLPLAIKETNSFLLEFNPSLHAINRSFQEMGKGHKVDQDPNLSHLQKLFFDWCNTHKKLKKATHYYNIWIENLFQAQQEQKTSTTILDFFWGLKVSDYLETKRDNLRTDLLQQLTDSLLFLSDCCAKKMTKESFLTMAAENYIFLAKKKSKELNEAPGYYLQAAQCFRKAKLKEKAAQNYNLAGEKYLILAHGTKGFFGEKSQPQYYTCAVDCFRYAGQYEKAGEIYANLAPKGQPKYYLEAAKCYLKAGKNNTAKDTFNKLENSVQDIDRKISEHLRTLQLEGEIKDIEIEVDKNLNIKVKLKNRETYILLEEKGEKIAQALASAIVQGFDIDREEATKFETPLDDLFLIYHKENDRIEIIYLLMKPDKKLAAFLASSVDTFENLPVYRHYFETIADDCWKKAWNPNSSEANSRKELHNALQYFYLAQEGHHLNVSPEWEEDLINKLRNVKVRKITFTVIEF